MRLGQGRRRDSEHDEPQDEAGGLGEALGGSSAGLTAEMAASVRFPVSKPAGYFYTAVETYVQQVSEAMAALEDDLFAEQQRTHELTVELDHQVHDVQSLRSQIEVFRVNGNPVVNADGSYQTESQQSEQAQQFGSEEQITQIQAQLEETRVSYEQAAAALEQSHVTQKLMQDEIDALREWGERMTSEMEVRDAAIAERDQALIAAYADVQELRLQVAVQIEGGSALPAGSAGGLRPHFPEVQVDPAVGDYTTTDSTPLAEYDPPGQPGGLADGVEQSHADAGPYVSAGEQPGAFGDDFADLDALVSPPVDVSGRRLSAPDNFDDLDGVSQFGADQDEEPTPMPVGPFDSELPPGAVLSGGIEGPMSTFTYTEAAPGTPIYAVGPTNQWAPELDPELLAQVQAEQSAHDSDEDGAVGEFEDFDMAVQPSPRPRRRNRER